MIEALNQERQRKIDKEAISRRFPEPQEKKSNHQGCHQDRADQKLVHLISHSSKIKPYSKGSRAINVVTSRSVSKSVWTYIILSTSSSKLFSVFPIKQSPLLNSSRYRLFRYELNSSQAHRKEADMQ